MSCDSQSIFPFRAHRNPQTGHRALPGHYRRPTFDSGRRHFRMGCTNRRNSGVPFRSHLPHRLRDIGAAQSHRKIGTFCRHEGRRYKTGIGLAGKAAKTTRPTTHRIGNRQYCAYRVPSTYEQFLSITPCTHGPGPLPARPHVCRVDRYMGSL